MQNSSIELRPLGLVPYEQTWLAMQDYTATRTDQSPDQLWLLQHPPVYTLGLAGRTEHLLHQTDIPVIHVNRGGQITYHGPGQAVVYLLIDMARRNLKVRQLVTLMEQSVIDVLADWHITAQRREGAPGVYVQDAKIGALGLKITRGCCYHGLSLNVDMDLTPFTHINPCGCEGLRTTQIKDQGTHTTVEETHQRLAQQLQHHLDRHYPIKKA